MKCFTVYAQYILRISLKTKFVVPEIEVTCGIEYIFFSGSSSLKHFPLKFEPTHVKKVLLTQANSQNFRCSLTDYMEPDEAGDLAPPNDCTRAFERSINTRR